MPPGSAVPPLPSKTQSNRRLLGILFFFEFILGAIWTIILITPAGHESVYEPLALFFFIYPLHLICMIMAAFSLWKFRANLNLAILVLITPLILAVVPFLINVFAGGAPALQSKTQIQFVILCTLLLPAILALCLPRKVAFFLPVFLLKSFWLNLLFILVPILIYLTAAAALLQWSNLFSRASNDNDAGYLVLYGLLFAYIFAAITVIPAALIFLYSYLSFFQNHEKRRQGMRITQLVLSLPAIAVGVWILIRIFKEAASGV